MVLIMRTPNLIRTDLQRVKIDMIPHVIYAKLKVSSPL